jgi:hypothetical protein
VHGPTTARGTDFVSQEVANLGDDGRWHQPAGQDRGVPLKVRDPASPSARRSRVGNGRTGAGRGPTPSGKRFVPGRERNSGGDNDVLVSAMTAKPTQSRTSFSASLGTTKDARKIGKNLFPVHRKATISSSAASKV